MIVEIVSVGTELLLGNIVNTNAAYLAEECARLGLSCYYQTVVGDNASRLEAAIRMAMERADIVLLGGGLGPTPDDLTKEIAAKVFEKELRMNQAVKDSIETYMEKRGGKIAANNWKQAMVPDDAIVIENENGTAPGLIMEKNGNHLILLPGPPNEMIPMFDKHIRSYLDELEPGIIYSQTVKVCGVMESSAAEAIADLIENQTNPTIATYAKTGEVHLRVTAKAEDEKEAKKLVKPVVKELKTRFGNSIYTTEPEISLEKAVVDLLLANELTVSTVESCTGGMLAAKLINVAGVSESFKSGFVTYSNKAKRKLVGVKKSTLIKYGAVSKDVAEEMVKGAAIYTKSDVVAATTGVAGPDGGTKEKPVGLVYVSCYVCGKTKTKECHFSGDRMKIREASVAAALCLMRECILEYYSNVMFGKKS